MSGNQSLSHTKWNCKYHIVFAPKFRRQAIYLKLKEEEKRGNQIALSAGIYPEPELPEKFDPESVARAVAVYEKPKAKPAAKREPLPRASAPAEKIPVLTLKVTERGEKSAEDTRLFVLSGENSAQSR